MPIDISRSDPRRDSVIRGQYISSAMRSSQACGLKPFTPQDPSTGIERTLASYVPASASRDVGAQRMLTQTAARSRRRGTPLQPDTSLSEGCLLAVRRAVAIDADSLALSLQQQTNSIWRHIPPARRTPSTSASDLKRLPRKVLKMLDTTSITNAHDKTSTLKIALYTSDTAKHYVAGNTYDRGSFGKIKLAYTVNNAGTPERVVLKMLRLQEQQRSIRQRTDKKTLYSASADVDAEIERLRRVYGAESVDTISDTGKKYIVLPYRSLNLENFDYAMQALPMSAAVREVYRTKLLHQWANALVRVHDASLVHLDLKLPNMLIDAQGNVEVADFGLSKMLSAKNRTVKPEGRATPYYAAPEVVKSRFYKTTEVTQKADMWPLGVLLYNLYNPDQKYPSMRGSSVEQTLNRHKAYAVWHKTVTKYVSDRAEGYRYELKLEAIDPADGSWGRVFAHMKDAHPVMLTLLLCELMQPKPDLRASANRLRDKAGELERTAREAARREPNGRKNLKAFDRAWQQTAEPADNVESYFAGLEVYRESVGKLL
jgi:serine/threonine protein kinase